MSNINIGARSSRPWDKGGAQSLKTFFQPFGPQFALTIRGAGPSPRSATGDIHYRREVSHHLPIPYTHKVIAVITVPDMPWSSEALLQGPHDTSGLACQYHSQVKKENFLMETALTKETQHSSLHFPGETEQIVQTVPSYLKKRTAEFKVEDLVEDSRDSKVSKGLFKQQCLSLLAVDS